MALSRDTEPLGDLNLGKGTKANTGATQVYEFRHGNYVCQVLGGRGDHRYQGTSEVFKNGHSIVGQACTHEG